jgi:DNA repair protein RadC
MSSVQLAESILYQYSHVKGLSAIMHLTLEELTAIKGVGQVKAVQILCIAELAKRIAKTTIGNQVEWNSPDMIAAYYMEELRHKEQEELRLILLNTKNRLIQDIVLTKGTVNTSLISPREVFLEALRYHAVHIILMHNHPSGDPKPSKEDVAVTLRIQKAGELLGIYLLDHIIIGDCTYVSMKSEGYLSIGGGI